MRARPVLSALLDLAMGLGAITLVVGSCFVSKRVAFDLRLLFAITGTLFMGAGLLRGSPQRNGYAWRTVRVAAPGLLGTAALIVNNGFHRLEVPVGLILIAVFGVVAAFAVRALRQASRERSWAVGLAALIAILGASFLFVPQMESHAAFVASGGETAQFQLSTEGGSLSTANLRGQVVVMAFWASWCAACIEEMPQIQEVYRHYGHDSRVAVYAVEVDWHGETPEAGRRCFTRHGFDVPRVFDAGDAARSFKIDSLPSIVLIDAKGRVRFTHNGYDLSENLAAGLERHIDSLLAAN